jgi:hypothetical protein
MRQGLRVHRVAGGQIAISMTDDLAMHNSEADKR